MNKEIPAHANSKDYVFVKAAITGDQKAFAELMKKYRDSIYHLMYKMVRNRDDAEDLTLEAFGKAFNKLESYVPNYAFSTWLFKIATNNCIDFIRKKKLTMYSIDEPMDKEGGKGYSDNLKSGVLDPEEKYIRDQKLKHMRTVLRKMNLKYRLMIELRFFEELSYEQISKELDIPLGTVKAQLFRAKEVLLNLMKSNNSSDHMELTGRFLGSH